MEGTRDQCHDPKHASIGGRIASRVVLLKEVRDDGFVFYTNYNSTKGQSIAHDHRVCLSFFGRVWNVR